LKAPTPQATQGARPGRKERNDMDMRALALKVLEETRIKEELGEDYDEEWAITYALTWVQDDHTEEEALEAIRHQLR